MPFQTQINIYPEKGVEGQLASQKMPQAALEGDFKFIVGAAGLTAGRFAYADPLTGLVTNVIPAGKKPTGFVPTAFNARITTWAAESSMLIPAGREITLYTSGDWFVRAGLAAAVDNKVFAVLADGTISAGAAGAVIAGAVETEWYVRSSAAVGEIYKMGTWA